MKQFKIQHNKYIVPEEYKSTLEYKTAINRINKWKENYMLDLYSLNLKWLPPLLPRNLKELYCGWNKLTRLPNLPKGLQYLNCGWNQLTSLPNLPNLQRLDCSDNKLTSLPNLPNLQRLDCSNNKLTSLSNLPKGLLLLKYQGNKLNKFHNLPDSLKTNRIPDTLQVLLHKITPSDLSYLHKINF
jgi:Leucine-rich repeat (LRR) protein